MAKYFEIEGDIKIIEKFQGLASFLKIELPSKVKVLSIIFSSLATHEGDLINNKFDFMYDQVNVQNENDRFII